MKKQTISHERHETGTRKIISLLLALVMLLSVLPTAVFAAVKSLSPDGDEIEIGSYADLKKLSNEVNSGDDKKGFTYKLTEDITLGSDWVSIGTGNHGTYTSGWGTYDYYNFFSGTFNGDGHTITVPAGKNGIFQYVNEASIKNLNIKGENIVGSALVNDGDVTGTYAAGNSVIENVVLKSGSATTASGLVKGGTYSSGHTMTVKNCSVEDGATVGDGSSDNIGSICGVIQGAINGCSSYGTVNGKDFVGGIAAGLSNSAESLTVDSCKFCGTVSGSNYVGGILGSGTGLNGYGISYLYYSANANNASVTNCLVEGTVSASGEYVGGIIGANLAINQYFNVSKVSNNLFSGNISSSASDKGAVIGYIQGMNRNDIFENNLYSADSALDPIGRIFVLDTSKDVTSPLNDIRISTEYGGDVSRLHNLKYEGGLQYSTDYDTTTEQGLVDYVTANGTDIGWGTLDCYVHTDYTINGTVYHWIDAMLYAGTVYVTGLTDEGVKLEINVTDPVWGYSSPTDYSTEYGKYYDGATMGGWYDEYKYYIFAEAFRTDDPLGADSGKIAKPVSDSELTDGTALAMLGSAWKKGLDGKPTVGYEYTVISSTRIPLDDTVKLSPDSTDDTLYLRNAAGGILYIGVIADRKYDSFDVVATGGLRTETLDFNPKVYGSIGELYCVVKAGSQYKKNPSGIGYIKDEYGNKVPNPVAEYLKDLDYEKAKSEAARLSKDNPGKYVPMCQSNVYVVKVTVPQNYTTTYKAGTVKLVGIDGKEKFETKKYTIVSDVSIFEYEYLKEAAADGDEVLVNSSKAVGYSNYLNDGAYGIDYPSLNNITNQNPTVVCKTAFRAIEGKNLTLNCFDAAVINIPEVAAGQGGVNFANNISEAGETVTTTSGSTTTEVSTSTIGTTTTTRTTTTTGGRSETKSVVSYNLKFYGTQQIMSDFTIDWHLGTTLYGLRESMGIKLEENDIITYYIVKDGNYFDEFTVDYSKGLDELDTDEVMLTLNGKAGDTLGKYSISLTNPADATIELTNPAAAYEVNPETGAAVMCLGTLAAVAAVK